MLSQNSFKFFTGNEHNEFEAHLEDRLTQGLVGLANRGQLGADVAVHVRIAHQPLDPVELCAVGHDGHRRAGHPLHQLEADHPGGRGEERVRWVR